MKVILGMDISDLSILVKSKYRLREEDTLTRQGGQGHLMEQGR